jgi:VWFA-related protein
MRRLVTVTAAGIGLLVLALHADQPPVRPTFRAGTDVVPFDVSVLDRHRHPVRGLTAQDFTVLVDGKPMPLSAFTEVDLPPAVPAAAMARGGADPDNAVSDDAVHSQPASPHADDGRLVVILFDQSISPGPPMMTARKIATAAVNQLGPADQAAVLYMGVGAPQNFTSDRRLLLRAISGSDTGATLSVDAREEWAMTAVPVAAFTGVDPMAELATVSSGVGSCFCGLCVPEEMKHIADTLRDIPRRKSVLFIGDAITWQDPQADCVGRLHEATTKMFDALNLANLTIHSLSPSGLDAIVPAARASSPVRNMSVNGQLVFGVQQAATTEMADHLTEEGSLHVLPDYTGGRVVKETNDPDLYVPEIFAESASYYVIGVSTDAHDSKRPLKIQVKVNRDDLDVRARREYLAPASTPASPDEALAAAVPGLMPSHTMTLAATAAPFAAPGKSDPLVLVVLHVQQQIGAGASLIGAGPAETAARADRFDVVAGALDQYARYKASSHHTVSVAFHGTGALDFEVFSRLALKPGRYEIRIGATGSDPSETGALSTYLDVPDFTKDPVALSGLMLEATPTARLVSADAFRDVIPVIPTARRAFAKTDHVAAFLRVYQRGSDAVQPITVAASIAAIAPIAPINDGADREVWQQATRLASDAFGTARAADARITVPMDQLAAGDYVLRVQAGDGAHAPQRAVKFTVTK